MEYLLGSIVTSLTMLVMYRWLEKKHSNKKTMKLDIRQSKYLSIALASMREDDPSFEPATTQSLKHFDAQHLRILFMDGQAYWITNNIFYTADIVDGDVDQDSTRQVDTMAMDKVQLKKTIYIVEKLTEGLENNERGNSGNKGV